MKNLNSFKKPKGNYLGMTSYFNSSKVRNNDPRNSKRRKR